MSNKSRARGRAEPAPEPSPKIAEQNQQIGDVMEAMETVQTNPRAGIAQFVDAVFSARDRAEADAEPDPVEPDREVAADPDPLREPTPYERAVLSGMVNRPMYGGTVEPWRVDERRRKTRRARKARQRNRLAKR